MGAWKRELRAWRGSGCFRRMRWLGWLGRYEMESDSLLAPLPGCADKSVRATPVFRVSIFCRS